MAWAAKVTRVWECAVAPKVGKYAVQQGNHNILVHMHLQKLFTYVTKLDMYGVLRSVAAILVAETVRITYMSRSPLVTGFTCSFQIRGTFPT